MSIIVNKAKNLFTLLTKNSSYQMKVNELGVLLHQYYGTRVNAEDMGYQIQYMDIGFSGNPYDSGLDRTFSLDTVGQEYSSYGVGDYRISSIEIEHSDGSRALDLRYVSYEITDGTYQIPNMPCMFAKEEEAQTLTVLLKDKSSDIMVTLYYSVLEQYDIITRAVKVENQGETSIKLEKVNSALVDFLHGTWELVHFHGRHAMERQMERISLMHGIQSVGSTRGTSSHHHNPFAILCEPDAGEEFGCCYGFSLVYSGSFLIETEVDQLNQTRITMGIHPQQFSYLLNSKETFYSPQVIMTFSNNGFTSLSHKLHRAVQKHIIRSSFKEKRKPVLLNNWEATYFDFNEEKLYEIAKGAALLGVEMLVMDDGWFGKRENDSSGLGDWEVNTNKLKGGLKPLVDKINELGLKFGIWIEPEMISEDSDLYRTHPDWALKIPNRNPSRSRYQLVLDMSREEVRTYIYEKLCAVLDSANIEYVKWDMNRSISDIYSIILSADRQGEVAHRYILGVYELLEKLTSRYPNLLLEGCSGGGGRFDLGMLYYSPQIWCSDDTDAIERIKIQYGTSFGYPISAIGSHVSAIPNHQTGRNTPIETRRVVAMSGTFGYELDLNKLTEEEKETVKEQIQRFKDYYNVIQYGDYYRLTNPMKQQDYAAWQYVSEDKKESLVHGVVIAPNINMVPIHICLKGLESDIWYHINGSKERYSGSMLMYGGILFPKSWGDYQPVEFYITAE